MGDHEGHPYLQLRGYVEKVENLRLSKNNVINAVLGSHTLNTKPRLEPSMRFD